MSGHDSELLRGLQTQTCFNSCRLRRIRCRWRGCGISSRLGRDAIFKNYLSRLQPKNLFEREHEHWKGGVLISLGTESQRSGWKRPKQSRKVNMLETKVHHGQQSNHRVLQNTHVEAISQLQEVFLHLHCRFWLMQMSHLSAPPVLKHLVLRRLHGMQRTGTSLRSP